MKYTLAIVALIMLGGCDERYRYPCQDPRNWDQSYCKKPFCSANGTCPENLQHYVKDGDKNKQPQVESKETKGGCK